MAGSPAQPSNDDPIEVEVLREGRLRTHIHWDWSGNRVRIRAPRSLDEQELKRHVDEIVAKVKRRRARVRARADFQLEALGRRLNDEHFGGEIQWHSIRWVSNMEKRLGSCNNGGPTDGDIRISERIRGWPEWVVAYVVAHELVHRRYPNHGPEFWATLGRYPQAERARGFIQGVAYQLGEDAAEWL